MNNVSRETLERGNMKVETYTVTEQYIDLVHKAYLFAELCEYDHVIVDGHFEFYNSPNCRGFSFDVDPATYWENGVSTIMKAFNER